MSKKYNRYFLIFNEEDKGFEVASDKQPTGYTKIETKSGKCKITVYAQNLKADNGPYVCYLVDSTKKPVKVARLGEFLVDDTGKGETVWEQDAKNILGTGLSSDKFNVAAVVKEGNRLQVPLAGYSGKDKVQWRDKINSRSFTEEVEEVKEVKEVKESKKKKSKSSESKNKDSLRDPVEETEEDIKDQISQIVEKAESEVLEENQDIVNEARLTDESDAKEVELDEEVDLSLEEEARASEEEEVLEDSFIDNSESVEDIASLESIDPNDYDRQLQRDDDDYIDSYSEEGMAFKHYEQEINLQDADINYASRMTTQEELNGFETPEVNKMHVFDNKDYVDEDYRLEEDEEFLCDARDLEIQSLEYTPSILTRAIERTNIDRNKLCKDIKEDFNKLDSEIEKEVKRFLQRELEKYKKVVLRYVCKKEHSHGGNTHKHHEHHHDKHEHNCGCHNHEDGHQHHCEDHHEHGHHEHKESECTKGEGKKKKGYARALHGILSKHEKVSVKGAKDCNFWKVHEHDKFPNKDSSMHPYHSAIHHLKMTYPYINYVKYFKPKGYYYFGMKYDKDSEVKYLIYGIEGDKKENHQPYKGMTGFVSWVPHGNTGIWLMYYNPYTGCIMLPKGKGDKKR